MGILIKFIHDALLKKSVRVVFWGRASTAWRISRVVKSHVHFIRIKCSFDIVSILFFFLNSRFAHDYFWLKLFKINQKLILIKLQRYFRQLMLSLISAITWSIIHSVRSFSLNLILLFFICFLWSFLLFLLWLLNEQIF